MKKLILMRHGKSDWTDDALNDFDRTLNERGFKASSKMGEVLKSKNIIPDLILSSPAVRAKTTAELFAKSIGYQKEINFVDDFYFGVDESIIEEAKKTDNSVQTLMIVGHNPTMEEITSRLTLDNEYVVFKTATIVVFSVPINKWSGLKNEICEIEMTLYPKDF